MRERLAQAIEQARVSGALRADAAENIRTFLAAKDSGFNAQVIAELAGASAWPELNDRFYKTLAFGTGGLRGGGAERAPAPATTASG